LSPGVWAFRFDDDDDGLLALVSVVGTVVCWILDLVCTTVLKKKKDPGVDVLSNFIAMPSQQMEEHS